ncbi:hypothetical protein PsYK624_047260 [Phanerochaete sordida]|uniref:BTB domain-containing protein n=1 Tax=Phanerochaete sordida TaxID=48140 RepID=A0A9P3G5G8_9APHY|nr:hypothetical protein PsYK624_047260 [Phanerochaete sordida]
MFSLPQTATAHDPPKLNEDELALINMEEDQKTLDCLLRCCYPVKNPSFLLVAVLDRVLAAAMKYDLEVAIEFSHDYLYTQAVVQPLHVYTIACAYNRESLALRAAMCWKESAAVGSADLFEHGTSRRPRFEGTLAGVSYLQDMGERITAGCFFRLVQHAHGNSQRSFCRQWQPISWIIRPAGEGDDVASLSCQHPFDRPDADLKLMSSDGFTFKAHRIVLEMNVTPESGRTLEDMLYNPVHSTPSAEHGLPTFALSEDGESLALLLQLCYPSRPGTGMAQWNFDKLRSSTTKGVIHSARTYGLLTIVETYKARLLDSAKSEPFVIFFLALSFGWYDIAKIAARELCFFPIHSAYCPEMEDVPAKHYHYLLQYHHKCQSKIRETVASKFYTPSAWFPLNRFDWLVLPEMTARQSGNSLWHALLEKEVAISRKTGGNKYTLDWKAMADAKSAIEGAIESTLNSFDIPA